MTSTLDNLDKVIVSNLKTKTLSLPLYDKEKKLNAIQNIKYVVSDNTTIVDDTALPKECLATVAYVNAHSMDTTKVLTTDNYSTTLNNVYASKTHSHKSLDELPSELLTTSNYNDTLDNTYYKKTGDGVLTASNYNDTLDSVYYRQDNTNVLTTNNHSSLDSEYYKQVANTTITSDGISTKSLTVSDTTINNKGIKSNKISVDELTVNKIYEQLGGIYANDVKIGSSFILKLINPIEEDRTIQYTSIEQDGETSTKQDEITLTAKDGGLIITTAQLLTLFKAGKIQFNNGTELDNLINFLNGVKDEYDAGENKPKITIATIEYEIYANKTNATISDGGEATFTKITLKPEETNTSEEQEPKSYVITRTVNSIDDEVENDEKSSTLTTMNYVDDNFVKNEPLYIFSQTDNYSINNGDGGDYDGVGLLIINNRNNDRIFSYSTREESNRDIIIKRQYRVNNVCCYFNEPGTVEITDDNINRLEFKMNIYGSNYYLFKVFKSGPTSNEVYMNGCKFTLDETSNTLTSLTPENEEFQYTIETSSDETSYSFDDSTTTALHNFIQNNCIVFNDTTDDDTPLSIIMLSKTLTINTSSYESLTKTFNRRCYRIYDTDSYSYNLYDYECGCLVDENTLYFKDNNNNHYYYIDTDETIYGGYVCFDKSPVDDSRTIYYMLNPLYNEIDNEPEIIIVDNSIYKVFKNDFILMNYICVGITNDSYEKYKNNHIDDDDNKIIFTDKEGLENITVIDENVIIEHTPPILINNNNVVLKYTVSTVSNALRDDINNTNIKSNTISTNELNVTGINNDIKIDTDGIMINSYCTNEITSEGFVIRYGDDETSYYRTWATLRNRNNKIDIDVISTPYIEISQDSDTTTITDTYIKISRGENTTTITDTNITTGTYYYHRDNYDIDLVRQVNLIEDNVNNIDSDVINLKYHDIVYIKRALPHTWLSGITYTDITSRQSSWFINPYSHYIPYKIKLNSTESIKCFVSRNNTIYPLSSDEGQECYDAVLGSVYAVSAFKNYFIACTSKGLFYNPSGEKEDWHALMIVGNNGTLSSDTSNSLTASTSSSSYNYLHYYMNDMGRTSLVIANNSTLASATSRYEFKCYTQDELLSRI